MLFSIQTIPINIYCFINILTKIEFVSVGSDIFTACEFYAQIVVRIVYCPVFLFDKIFCICQTGRPQKKVDEDVSTSVASTTSDTQPQKRARSNATKKSASNAQNTRVNDSSVSELSMPASSASQSGKRQNDKGASLSKVSMKSKKSMTKTKPKPAKKTMVCIGIVFILLI